MKPDERHQEKKTKQVDEKEDSDEEEDYIKGGAAAVFQERLRSLGLHDEKFSSKLLANERVKLLPGEPIRVRKRVAVDCKSLLSEP